MHYPHDVRRSIEREYASVCCNVAPPVLGARRKLDHTRDIFSTPSACSCESAGGYHLTLSFFPERIRVQLECEALPLPAGEAEGGGTAPLPRISSSHELSGPSVLSRQVTVFPV